MKKKLIILSLVIALPFLISAVFISTSPTNEADRVEVTETIKLYSNGKLIGEWEGIGQGKMEGNSYTFTTSRGAFREDVRIQGDFVVERQPN